MIKEGEMALLGSVSVRDVDFQDTVGEPGVVRFGEKYKQWNAAFDAGYAAALGKSIIVLNPPEHQHALKEVHAAALAVAEQPSQVVEILRYVLTGELPGRSAAAAE